VSRTVEGVGYMRPHDSSPLPLQARQSPVPLRPGGPGTSAGELVRNKSRRGQPTIAYLRGGQALPLRGLCVGGGRSVPPYNPPYTGPVPGTVGGWAVAARHGTARHRKSYEV
jgi:hypothetical protein